MEIKIEKFNQDHDYIGMFEYLISLKNEMLTLPTSHKSSALTIQRAVLLVLPILKAIDQGGHSKERFLKAFNEFCNMIELSDYPLSIRVNA